MDILSSLSFRYGKIVNELSPLKRIVTLSVSKCSDLNESVALTIHVSASTIENVKTLTLERTIVGSFSDVVDEKYTGPDIPIDKVFVHHMNLSRFSHIEFQGIRDLIEQFKKDTNS